MAIDGIVRKMLIGERPAAGARLGVRALELADYDALFRGRSIYSGFREHDARPTLYQRILGPAFSALPAPLRELHGSSVESTWVGSAEVRRGRGLGAALIAALVGFPKAAEAVPVSVTFSPEGATERWTRSFGGRTFSAVQSAGSGRDEFLLMERFGCASFALALVVEDGRLALIPRRWSLLKVPMPRFLMPSGPAFEDESDGRFYFSVEISAPLIGLIVAYRGTLVGQAENDEAAATSSIG